MLFPAHLHPTDKECVPEKVCRIFAQVSQEHDDPQIHVTKSNPKR